jgi:AcrR family transcriptional regulator
MEKPLRNDRTSNGSIKMADLARLSELSKSVIHFYLKMGLLHPAKKLGLSLSVYDWTHLDKLRRIRDLRENQKLPLSKIKDLLSIESLQSSSSSSESDVLSLISTIEEERRVTKDRKTRAKKTEIMDAAISLFSKNGYQNTTIDAIADSLHMAKSTVYLYFESKEDLFMECIERLTVVAVPEYAWDDIRKEKNALTRLRKRGLAFLRAFPSYKGILTMTKAVLGGDNQKLAEKAKNTLFHMTRPMANDLRKGVADGLFREMDEEVIAHLFLAMGEGLGCRLMIDSRYTIEQVTETMYDLVSHGILKNHSAKAPKAKTRPLVSEVTDLKGVVTKVRNFRFGSTSYLPVKIGNAEVRIDPEKVERIQFVRRESSLEAQITRKDGQTEKVEIDGDLSLSGDVAIGEFSLQLKDMASLLFVTKELERSEIDAEEKAE